MDGGRILVLYLPWRCQLVPAGYAVIHDGDCKIQYDHVDVFHHDIVLGHIVIDLLHNKVDHPLIQILVLIIGVAFGVIIPVLGKKPVQKRPSLPLVRLERDGVLVAVELNVRRRKDIVGTECMKVMLQRCSADKHLILQVVKIHRLIGKA